MLEWYTDEYRADQRAAYEAIRAKHPDLVTVGFDCYAGWLPILERFFDTVAAALAEAPGVKFELWHVKEKLAGLRIYYVVRRSKPPLTVDTQTVREDDARRKIDDAYEQAERDADRACEVCGRAGIFRKLEGFYCTRCEDHADGAVPVKPGQ